MSRSKLLAGGALLLLAALTFALQSYNIGFWSYRHGWTSVHGLAIMGRATPENRFLGYSMLYREGDDTLRYDYFDRYPPFFSASVRAVLSLTDDLPTQIYLARLYMNVFFVASLFVGYRLARLFLASRVLAVGAVALAFSSYYLLYYRDMTDFYQPVALNFLVLAYSIARYRLYGEQRQVLAVAALTTLIGFGYAMLFMLGVWFLVEAASALTDSRQKLLRAIWGPPTWAILISLTLTAAAIGVNVTTEAAVRGVAVTETSIVDSMLRRIPFVEGAVSQTAREQAATSKGVVGWGEFGLVQFERLVRWATPLKTGGATGVQFFPGVSAPRVVWAWEPLRDEITTQTTPAAVLLNGWLLTGGAGALAWLVVFIARQPAPLRGTAVVIAFGGLPLVFGLINLTAVHDYTLMFATGFNVMLWTALLSPADGRPRLALALACAGVGLYAASLWSVRTAQTSEIEQGAPFTYDANRMREALGNAGHTIYLDVPRENPECVIREWQCYALGYYLGGHALTTHLDVADYALSFEPYFSTTAFVDPGATAQVVPRPTHPENERLYLLDLAAAEPRTAPDAPTYRFGDHLALGEWALAGGTSAPPCARVTVEGWWLAESVPDANYNLQVVMVGAGGEAVAEANAPLGPVPTRIWEVGRYTFDARSFVIPCETPPGEYPLIMGAYDPSTLVSLLVTTADGEALGNQLYLTTLTVSQ